MNGEKARRRHPGMVFLLPLMLLVAAMSAVTAQMASSNYQISSAVFDEGGGQVSSSNYRVEDSIGQSIATGILQSPSYSLSAGFMPTTLAQFTESEARIRLSADILDWGEVSVGSSANKILTIYNDGLATLEVSEIFSDDPQFFCMPESLSVDGMGLADVTVTFAPASEGTFEATLTILCNDADEEMWYITLLGVGVEGCQGGLVGDVTGDGSINVIDVLATVNHILTIVLLDEDGQCRADCNCDGTINIIDALGIVNVILEIGQCGPACKPMGTSEVVKFLKSLEPYISAENFEEFMALVKAEVGVPSEYSLAQNYPNPFNPITTIEYTLQEGSNVKIEVYNLLGQVVKVLVDSEQVAGHQAVQWDASDMASGVYFYQLTAGDFTATRRMVLMK